MARSHVLTIAASLAAAGLLASPPAARAQANEPPPAVTPSTPAPEELPPLPSPAAEGPAASAPPPAPAPAAPAGSWVYTQQYGWVWMPYGAAYTFVPRGRVGEPLAYVYYPAYGWHWVAAPWVWGIGPWPYFGVRGPRPYFWYGRGWWRTPGRWRFRPAPLAGDPAWHAHGIRPAPAPAVRAGPVRERREHRVHHHR